MRRAPADRDVPAFGTSFYMEVSPWFGVATANCLCVPHLVVFTIPSRLGHRRGNVISGNLTTAGGWD
jgi:hypothetical protein